MWVSLEQEVKASLLILIKAKQLHISLVISLLSLAHFSVNNNTYKKQTNKQKATTRRINQTNKKSETNKDSDCQTACSWRAAIIKLQKSRKGILWHDSGDISSGSIHIDWIDRLLSDTRWNTSITTKIMHSWCFGVNNACNYLKLLLEHSWHCIKVSHSFGNGDICLF